MFTKVLTDGQINKIHQTSLSVLDEVGVIVPHPEVLSRFKDSGAKVDFQSQRVRIPPDLLMRCLRQAGKEFTIYGRDLSHKAEFGTGKRNYNASSGEASWVDNIGETRRYAILDDVATAPVPWPILMRFQQNTGVWMLLLPCSSTPPSPSPFGFTTGLPQSTSWS